MSTRLDVMTNVAKASASRLTRSSAVGKRDGPWGVSPGVAFGVSMSPTRVAERSDNATIHDSTVGTIVLSNVSNSSIVGTRFDSVQVSGAPSAVCACVCVCVCVCVHTFHYTYVIYLYIYAYICIYICVYIRTHIHIYRCIYVYMCLYIYIYIIHIHQICGVSPPRDLLGMYVCVCVRIYV